MIQILTQFAAIDEGYSRELNPGNQNRTHSGNDTRAVHERKSRANELKNSLEAESFVKTLVPLSREELTCKDFDSVYYGPYHDQILPYLNFSPDYSVNRGRTALYPLSSVSNNSDYKTAVNALVRSKSPYNRALGFIVAASANDKSFLRLMSNALKSMQPSDLGFWAAASLLYLRSTDGLLIFDYLVAYDGDDGHNLWPNFFRLDDQVRKTVAYKRMESPKKKAQKWALVVLTTTKPCEESRSKLMSIFDSITKENKKYAIRAMHEQRIGNLRTRLSPFLTEAELRGDAYRALLYSPSKDDRVFAIKYANSLSVVPISILENLLLSKATEDVEEFLKIVKLMKLEERYQCNESCQPLLKSERLAKPIMDTIETTSNRSLIPPLVRCLASNRDRNREALVSELLQAPEPAIREAAKYCRDTWAGRTGSSLGLQ